LGANLSIGVAGAAALTGAIIWIVDTTTRPPAVAFSPWLSGDGGGAALGTRF